VFCFSNLNILTVSCIAKMTFEYHVTCIETKSKKIIAVDDKLGIVAKIKERFGVSTELVLQLPYGDDWVDVEDLSDLPDGGKLAFLKKPVTGTNSCSVMFYVLYIFVAK